MKKLLLVLLVVAFAVGAGAFWLSRNLDHLVQQAIEHYGSAMTHATVSVGAVKISPTDGKGSISHLVVGNPAGFRTSHALKVARVEVEVDLSTVTQDVVVVRRLAIVAPDVIYEKGESQTNFDALAGHIAQSVGAHRQQPKESQGVKKLIVQSFTLQGVKAQLSTPLLNGKTIALNLPDIALKDVGRAKGGVTPDELGQEMVGALKSRLIAASVDQAMKSAGNAVGSVLKGLIK